MAKYKITLTIETDYHPRKWIAETIQDTLDVNEKFLDWDCELIEEDDQKQQDE